MRHSLIILAIYCTGVLLLQACGGQTATDAGSLYGCSQGSDCLVGYSCVCGFCQKPESVNNSVCDGSSSADTGSDAASSDDTVVDAIAPETANADAIDASSDSGGDATPPDAAPADTPDVPTLPTGPCNLATWKPCPTGSGCYYNPLTKVPRCEWHGSLPAKALCDPDSVVPPCGAGVSGEPLICDTQDKKCYATCVTNDPSPKKCEPGLTCFILKFDGKDAPDNAGICAP